MIEAAANNTTEIETKLGRRDRRNWQKIIRPRRRGEKSEQISREVVDFLLPRCISVEIESRAIAARLINI